MAATTASWSGVLAARRRPIISAKRTLNVYYRRLHDDTRNNSTAPIALTLRKQSSPGSVLSLPRPRLAQDFYTTAQRQAVSAGSKRPLLGQEKIKESSAFPAKEDAALGARDGGPRDGRMTLLARVGLVSALLVLSQPFLRESEGHGESESSKNNGDINRESASADSRDPSLPRYRLADVRKHGADSGTPWVTSGDRVYDITDWVAAHPGGDVILRAAGGSIDPYWKIFTIHRAPHVYEILQQYLIGLVDAADLVDGRPVADSTGIEDPFDEDPVRDDRLIAHTTKPCNAEPPRGELTHVFATPNELFYVRNHMWVPVVDPAAAGNHRLTVELPDGEVRSYTLDELRQRFHVHRVTAVLQCSGNRRSDMTHSVGPTNGLQWGVGAIGNAVWDGVLLRDVLADAGLTMASSGSRTEDAGFHVQLSGMEAYAASIPLPVALDPRGDVLLAFAMNGAPLPRDHGYPLRAIVPGHVAARSVKWLSRIVVADEESPSQWQRRDYKLFGPNEGQKLDWDKYPAIQEMPVTSAITGIWVGNSAGKRFDFHGDSARAAPGVRDVQAWQAANLKPRAKNVTSLEPVAVTGYAYSGGGREIVRVDVSLDGGRTWDQAELLDGLDVKQNDDDSSSSSNGIVARGARDWAWKRWRYTGQLYPSEGEEVEIIVKATDSAYNTQPERHNGIYNVRGNLATAWHRVRLGRDSGSGSNNSSRSGSSSDGNGDGDFGKTVWTMQGCGFGFETAQEKDKRATGEAIDGKKK